jgi:hypothetical protein
MKSPLMLMLLKNKGGKVWKVIRSERGARGWDPLAIVFVREPTKEEEATTLPYQEAGVPVCYLEDLLEDELDG